MVTERGKIHLPFGLFAILTKSDFFLKHAFFESPNGYGRSGTQTGMVPGRGKIHLPFGLFAILTKSVFFFQHVRASRDALVGRDPLGSGSVLGGLPPPKRLNSVGLDRVWLALIGLAWLG